jgi:putative transcriptional regulator
MRMHEQLCLPPMQEYSAAAIRACRHPVHQPSTVCQWEIGEKRPSGPSVKLLSVLDCEGLQALL